MTKDEELLAQLQKQLKQLVKDTISGKVTKAEAADLILQLREQIDQISKSLIKIK